MSLRFASETPPFPALQRLQALTPLDPAAIVAVSSAIAGAHSAPARRDFIIEGSAVTGPRLIVEGWAARVRIMPDGRRQFLSFLLPGDVIGLCDQPTPIACSTITALTRMKLCDAPLAVQSPSLYEAYAISRALDELYLLEHVARLGRMNAQERIYSLLLELNERLSLTGLAQHGGFDIPLTQEMLADALGLTSVHVNRMLQVARQLGAIDWRGRSVVLYDPADLARQIGRAPARVSG